MAAVTTHDLATMVGFLSGSDLEDQARLGTAPNVDDTRVAVARLRHWIGADPGDAEGSVSGPTDHDDEVRRIHELVAASPAVLASVTLDDLAATALRPNMPGTIDEWPNWRIPLPAPIDAVLATDRARDLRATMAARTAPTGGQA
jgi:4-alpha-glucanotransferase